MIDKTQFLRGRGPAPKGYAACCDPKCNQRDFATGRLLTIPNHYHPIVRACAHCGQPWRDDERATCCAPKGGF